MTAEPTSIYSPQRNARSKFHLLGALCVLVMLSGACSSADSTDDQPTPDAATDDVEQSDVDAQSDADQTPVETQQIRVATFNASLYRDEDGGLRDSLAGGEDAQAKKIAEVIQRVRPDIILVNEFDWDADGESAEIFIRDYLAHAQREATAIEYPHHYFPTTNTGVSTGIDLNNKDGAVTEPGSQAYGDDSFGFGQFPGQYGMLVLSRFPIDSAQMRSFQKFLWRDMPDNLQPTDWYSDEAVDIMRLSSKNHVDLPIDVDGTTLHLLISHPTPPSFDGREERNKKRNHDEVRIWVDYLSGGEDGAYLKDDQGGTGGFDGGSFVILGDLNSDPVDADSYHEGVRALLEHPRVQDPKPTSEGAVEATELDGMVNTQHEGDPALDTADFSDMRVGNIRIDYALPSADLTVVDQGVFWPTTDDPLADLVEVSETSDHHLVWVDVEIEKP